MGEQKKTNAFRRFAMSEFFNFLNFLEHFEDALSSSSVPCVGEVFNCSYPPMNVLVNETTKDIKFVFAVAGIPEDKISVTMEGDFLKVEVLPFSEEEGWKTIKKGIKSVSVKNKIYIPSAKYDTQNVKATINNGLLSIAFPALEKAKEKTVPLSKV